MVKRDTPTKTYYNYFLLDICLLIIKDGVCFINTFIFALAVNPKRPHLNKVIFFTFFACYHEQNTRLEHFVRL